MRTIQVDEYANYPEALKILRGEERKDFIDLIEALKRSEWA